ncbi:MAG: alanine racemase, partial [Bacillota bacterium]|nr:alanine racemase [Bacillota bacterium]
MFFENQTVNQKGHMEIGGCDTVALAEEFGTPLYVMDEDMLRNKCSRYLNSFKNSYPQVDIAYASKAFTVVAMCNLVKEEGMWLDFASLGELHTGLLARFDTSKIVFHGNFKQIDELQSAVKNNVKVVCDSYKEIEQLACIAAENKTVCKVLVRCNPGINPHTHTMISTGQEDSKFGFNIKSGDAIAAIKKILEKESLEFVGVHCHLGSQLLDAEPFRQVAPVMADFFA